MDLKANPLNNKVTPEIAAAIVAAVAVCMETTADQVVLKAVRPLPVNRQSRWARQGLKSQMASRL